MEFYYFTAFAKDGELSDQPDRAAWANEVSWVNRSLPWARDKLARVRIL